jgi:hypothetical protein
MRGLPLPARTEDNPHALEGRQGPDPSGEWEYGEAGRSDSGGRQLRGDKEEGVACAEGEPADRTKAGGRGNGSPRSVALSIRLHSL